MGYWQRKFHLQHKLSNGNTWKGMINVEADTEEELPETVKGTYYFYKTEEGWHGKFTLADGKADRCKERFTDYIQAVYTIGIYLPRRNFCGARNREEAEAIVAQVQDISHYYKQIDRYDCIIEDDIYETETHYWG